VFWFSDATYDSRKVIPGMKEARVVIPSTGIRLEGLMRIHEASSITGGVILCHPHPQYGGDMHTPVIAACTEASFLEGFSTLRFNFRGVGESEGSYGDGIGEKEDIQAALRFLALNLNNPNQSLILLGYSFGAWTGFQAAYQDAKITGMVGIAPPLAVYDFGFLRGCKKKKLFVVGDQDMFCPIPVLEKWYQDLEEPKSLTVLPGADHFFFSHVHALAQPLREFLKTFQPQ
jgi:uncharacterized protein